MNIYEDVTNRILEQLKIGVVPWRKTWKSGLPMSLTTKREYRGINILMLGLSGYRSRYWISYREALRLGAHVRKGEKATPVIYWHWRTPEQMDAFRRKSGREPAPCVPFISSVFNLEQVEGVARPEEETLTESNRRLELADNLFDVMPDKPEIVHSTCAEPCYSRILDRVAMPHLSQFESADEYYAALFHELTHATGSIRRLNRVAEQAGDTIERYSFEELVAEFGAAFLCGFAGIDNTQTQELAASYLAGWAQVFQKDTRILLRAASAAQRAADYIRGKLLPESEPASDAAEPISVATAAA